MKCAALLLPDNRWLRRRQYWVLAGLICVQSVGCSGRDNRLVLSGNLETDDHDLIAPITAQILSIRVSEGDLVALGDTVAVLDTVAASSTFRAAQASELEAQARIDDLTFGSDREKIRAARAEAEIARSTSAQAERDWARNDSLLSRGLIDSHTMEQATLARDNARSSLEAARQRLADLERGARTHQLDAARAVLDQAIALRIARQYEFERQILTASRAGIVQFLPFQQGEYVPAGRAVATINDPNQLWAKVYVPEARLSEVEIGDTLRFRVDAAPNTDYRAIVAFIAAEAEFTPRNVQTPDERVNLVFAVKVVVPPGQAGLRPGMPADFYFD